MCLRNFLIVVIFFFCVTTYAQNVGIGTSQPQERLDVAGRVRFRHNGQVTPGIYMDGSSQPNRGFVGHYDENHIGLYGAGAQWMLAMNFNNGNTSIGHAQPAATLDVQGSIRLRLPNAALGYNVASADASGNAKWNRPIAFKVGGSVGTALHNGQWVKPGFSNFPEYNLGFAWEPINQQFVAPLRGAYQFVGHFQTNSLAAEVTCRLIRTRNNVDTEMHTVIHRYQLGNTLLKGYHPVDFNVELLLETGDIVRVELRGGGAEYLPGIDGQPQSMFFSGRLITAL